MMGSTDAQGDTARERFAALLDQAARQSRKISFWWRDDDAIEVTPALERLLALARTYDLPLALAVIPEGATEALGARIAEEPNVSVLLHGWGHHNYAPPSEKKTELGEHRPLAAVTGELIEGRKRLSSLFPGKFLPVLVPPWNRIADTVGAARHDLGLPGLSTFGRASEPHEVNTHLDIMDWKTRGPLSRAAAYAKLADETERRLAGDAEPLGILTHHLVHQEGSWAFLEELFAMIARHPAAAWPPVAELFAVTPARAPASA